MRSHLKFCLLTAFVQEPFLASAQTCRNANRISAEKLPAGTPSTIPWKYGEYVGATLKPYSGHYNFYTDIDGEIKKWIDLYKIWHPNGKLLDVGGRNGELSYLAKNYKYSILDRDKPKDTVASKFEYLLCDLYDCELSSCQVEMIFSNNVLEHLLKPHDAMRTMGRLLKPGGLFAAKTQVIP